MALGVSGDKPKRAQDMLGPEVNITHDKAPDSPWARTTLKEIGKTLTPDQHTYMGSVAIHYYKTGDTIVAIDANKVGGLVTIQQTCLGTINEFIGLMGLANLQIEMRKHYGRTHKTTDSKDGRKS